MVDTKRKRIPLEKKTAQQLVKVADDIFSKAVRLRDSEYRPEHKGWLGTCITCSKYGLIARIDEDGDLRFVKGWDAGHFIGRGTKVTRFDEENVNLQCAFACNKMKSGNIEKYKPALDNKYGEGTYRKLEDLAQDTQYYKFSKDELLGIIHDSRETVAFYKSQTDN